MVIVPDINIQRMCTFQISKTILTNRMAKIKIGMIGDAQVTAAIEPHQHPKHLV